MKEEALYEQLQREATALLTQKNLLDTMDRELVAIRPLDDERLAKLEEERSQAKAQLEGITRQLQRVRALDEILQTMEEHNIEECPLCANCGVSPKELRKKLAEKLSTRGKDFARINKLEVDAINDIAVIKNKLSGDRLKLDQERATYDRARNSLKTRGEACKGRIDGLKQAHGMVEAYDGPSSQEIETQINNLRQAGGRKQRLMEDTTRLEALKADSARAKTLEGQAKKLLTSLLKQVAQDAEDTVNNYMPAGFKAALELSDTQCAWRVIGADGRAHSKVSMCGAEKGTLIIALALAWTEGSPLRILLLDDEDLTSFSPFNLGTFLTRIERLVNQEGLLTQAIITTTRPHEIPETWAKVDLAA